MRRNGKYKPFTALVDAYQAPVYTLCSLLLGDGPVAEEVAQECFTRAYVQFNQYSSSHTIQTWLLHIAYQQCLYWQAPSHNPVQRTGAGNSPISTGNSASLQSLLAGLEPEDRVVIALSYWYQLERQDIAWVMGTDGEMVQSRLRRAQKILLAQSCQVDPEYPH
jgi:RNA polymerase sigma-70 factor (ECF subfamily)